MSMIAGTDCEILRVPLTTFKEFLSPTLLDEYKSLFNMVFMRFSISIASRLVSVIWNCVYNIPTLSRQ